METVLPQLATSIASITNSSSRRNSRGRDSSGLCRFWAQGKCKKGDKCDYKHVGEANSGAVAAAQPRSRSQQSKDGKKKEEERYVYDYECRSSMTTNVGIDMTTNVAVI